MKVNRILLGILLLALGLRLVALGSHPPGLSWDEASLGYNAWSIALTGRDEHGRFLPVDAFAAFGDYKPPAYIYAAAPFVRFLGLNPFAVRLPSALAGVLAVYLTFVFTNHLLASESARLKPWSAQIALVAALLMAISPWHLQLSRAAVEANLATTFILAGVSLAVLSFQRPVYLPLAALLLVLSVYTFNSARVFTPLLTIGIGIIFARHWLAQPRWVGAAGVIGLAAFMPLMPFLLTPQARLRFHEVNIFSDLAIVQTANQRIEVDGSSRWARIVHNRRLEYGRRFLDHYFDHFSGEFLFGRGDENPKLSITKMGELYLVELPLLLYGLYLLIRDRSRASGLIIFWLLIAPIPAATARETPHALRTLVFLPTFPILTAIGLVTVWMSKKKLVAVAALLWLMLQFGLYLNYYYRDYPVEFAADWLTGYQPLVETVLAREKHYNRIVVTTAYGRPYIFFLFYGRIRPEVFWQEGKVETDVFGFKNVPRLGKIEFGQVNYQPGSPERSLSVGRPTEFPKGVQPLTVVRFLDGEPAFWLVE